MRSTARVLALLLLAAAPPLQAQNGWLDSLVKNTQVLPRTTRVIEVMGTMRNFTSALGVRCPFCHVGREGMELEQFDFASDQKRNKLVARQMMLMVQEIGRRVDTIPGRTAGLQVTCFTCHRGLSRPVPLSTVLIDAATAAGADSAIRAYRALRERYYGRDAYDFGEPSLNTAAFRLGRAGRFDDALAILQLNATNFPGSSGMEVFRGNILLMRGDTTGAAEAFREALKRDSTNQEARGRLATIGRKP